LSYFKYVNLLFWKFAFTWCCMKIIDAQLGEFLGPGSDVGKSGYAAFR
jgi:hypothetical protein